MFKRIQQLRSEKGFTLVELLVVVTILGVLSAVAVVAIGGSSGDSKAAACKTDVATVQAAADAFKAGNPDGDDAANIATDLVPKYLRAEPTNGDYAVVLTAGIASAVNTATPAAAIECDSLAA